MSKEGEESPKKRFKFNRNLTIVVIVLIILASIPAVYFYLQYKSSQDLLRNPTQAAKEEINVLVMKVGRHIDLPSSEVPTVATVSDKKKLSDQPFFSKAENGDKLLMYAKAGKAFLYRPSTDKLIEVAPLNIQNVTPTASPTTYAVPKTVTILNGSSVSGAAKSAETQLTTDSKTSKLVVVTTKGNAANSYEKTVIYDVTGKNKDLVSKVATLFNAQVALALPSGEKKPATEVLIILGSDFEP